jgi:hypothetical protein
MKVLHLIPEFVFFNTFHGAYKDVLCRTQWLDSQPFECLEVRLRKDDPAEIQTALSGLEPTHVLIEYTRFPEIIQAVRAALPDAWIGVRAHNIEPLQHLDNLGWLPKRGPLWMLYGMLRLLLQDVAAKRTADAVLSINEWENRIYWNCLPGRAGVEWLPYVCPQHLLPAAPQPYPERRVIACLPTSQQNRKSRDLVLRFFEFARQMKRQGCTDEFVVTGDLRAWDLPDCPEVTPAGFVEDLAVWMGRCKAICMLSPLGYGFKTTIADALAANAQVIAHPALVKRCPDAVKPFLLNCDSRCPQDIGRVQQEIQQDLHGIDLHRQLCSLAEGVLSRCFGEEGR